MADPMMWDVLRDPCKGSENNELQSEDEEKQEEGEEMLAGTFDDEVSAMMALLDRRAELTHNMPDEPEPFTYTLRGGLWTHAHAGVAYDSFRALASVGRPQLFCANYNFAKSATFSIRKFGEDLCIALCKAWTHRMKFMYTLWVESGALPTYRFDATSLNRFVPLPEVQALGDGASAAFKERLEGVNMLRPMVV